MKGDRCSIDMNPFMLPTNLTSCKMSEKSIGPTTIYVESINFAVCFSLLQDGKLSCSWVTLRTQMQFLFFTKKISLRK